MIYKDYSVHNLWEYSILASFRFLFLSILQAQIKTVFTIENIAYQTILMSNKVFTKCIESSLVNTACSFYFALPIITLFRLLVYSIVSNNSHSLWCELQMVFLSVISINVCLLLRLRIQSYSFVPGFLFFKQIGRAHV